MANILVYIETLDERADPACLDVLSSMRRVASTLGATLYAVMPTVEPPVYGEDDIVATISRHGADKVILLSHPSLAAPASFDSHGAAVLAATIRLPPSLLVFADTAGCRDVALGCSAALSAPVLVHPQLDMEQRGWPARVSSRFHDAKKVYLLEEMDRPIVILAAPGHDTATAGKSSDDAEVVVLSPKTTLRRLTARPETVPRLPQAGSDLLLAGPTEGLSAPARQQLELLAKRLGADMDIPGDIEHEETAPGPEKRFADDRSRAPWARTVMLFDSAPSLRRLSNLSRAAHLLWISDRENAVAFHSEAQVHGAPAAILEELVDLVPDRDERRKPGKARELHFRPSPEKSDETQSESENRASPTLLDTLVLLAGPEPRAEGPSLDVLLDFLEPARKTALSLPARNRLVLCCGSDAADQLLANLGRWPFDRLIRIASPISGPLATAGLARLLGAAIQKLRADLVVAGDQGGFWHRGITGPAVARVLDWPFITGAMGPFSITSAGLSARKRAWQTRWIWQVQTPALLCVAEPPPQDTAQEFARRAATPEITVWTLDDLGLQEQDVVPLCKQAVETGREKRSTARLESARDVLDWLSARRNQNL